MSSIDWTLVQYHTIVDDADDHGSCHADEGDQRKPDRPRRKQNLPTRTPCRI